MYHLGKLGRVGTGRGTSDQTPPVSMLSDLMLGGRVGPAVTVQLLSPIEESALGLYVEVIEGRPERLVPTDDTRRTEGLTIFAAEEAVGMAARSSGGAAE